MSVLIKGMEMPISCDNCFLPLRYCPAAMATNCDCPLVPVPKHGRLIDGDELHSALRKRAKEFSDSEYGEGVKCGLADAREYIKIAPTIIPAEEVYDKYTDTAGNLHWTGTQSGKHIIPAEEEE